MSGGTAGDGGDPVRFSHHGDIADGGSFFQIGSVSRLVVGSRERSIPREMPAPTTARWSNRTDEIAELCTAIEDAVAGVGPKLIVVQGEYDVGRTEFVSRCESRFRERFPDGTVYRDLTTHIVDGTLDVDAALIGLTASVDEGDLRDLGLASRINRWRSVTAGRRLLVVLDNLDDPPALTDLVSSAPGVVTIVIARYNAFEFDLAGARIITLDRLAVDHAMDILASWTPGDSRLVEEADLARRLVEMCDGRPRLVHMLGSSIARSVGSPLSAIKDAILGDGELPESQDRVTAAFVAHFREHRVDAAARRLLDRLASCPGNDHPAEVVDWLHGGDASDAIAALVESDLVTSTTAGRWRVPDRVRAHCEAIDVLDDLAVFYVGSTRLCDETLLDRDRLRIDDGVDTSSPLLFRPTDKAAAERWLSGERHNIAVLAARLFDRGDHRRVWSLEQSLWALYRTHMPLEYWRENAERAVEAATREGHPTAEARMRAQHMDVLMRLGRTDEAEREIVRAVELARGNGDRRLEASCVEFHGLLARRRGDHRSALTRLHYALYVNVELDRPRSMGLLNRLIGEVHIDLREYGCARRHLDTALSALVPERHLHHHARTLAALARLEAATGEPRTFGAAIDRAVDALREAGSRRAIPDLYESCGDLLRDRGDVPGARRCWSAALRVHIDYDNEISDAVARLRGRLSETSDGG